MDPIQLVAEFKKRNLLPKHFYTQHFEYTFHRGGCVVWNIDRAIELVNENKFVKLVTVDRLHMQDIISANEHDPTKLDRVDVTYPGIAAPVIENDGSLSYILIDGHKRIVRCYREQKPFWAYLLTDEVSLSCVLIATKPNLLPIQPEVI